jgi:hypothetical protein
MDEQEKNARTQVRAYHLWEKEGRPHGRALDHWLEAERHEAAMAVGAPRDYGNGDRAAVRESMAAENAFARSGPVVRKARRVKRAVEGAEGEIPQPPERTGRRRGRGKDPEVTH